ncbi:hypothetical protein I79_009029 [Cricetulus griseus]|uniref:Uncharacterized protein n=1 Tax=Cricetulus griseus TaxID=10029 RepID=G3HEP1_CRIGR|nr:hypothetical protein I79_009029 [Cricetulus griseus]
MGAGMHPSTVAGLCRNSHTPWSAICRVGGEVSRIPEVPSVQETDRPLENPAGLLRCGSLRLPWAHVAAPGERADQPPTPTSPTPHSPCTVKTRASELDTGPCAPWPLAA